MRAQGFGELEFALAEGARGAVEDEADEEPPVDVDRQGHGVADADRAVIVVVERRLHEGLAWNEIADSPGHRRWIASMCTDQRMLWKVAIENFDLSRRNRARGVAHDAAVVAVEVAHRERGELGTDHCGERGDAAAGEAPRRVAFPADGVKRVKRRMQIPARKRGHRELVLPTSKSSVNYL